MRGETVVVERRVQRGVDSLRDPVWGTEEETVEDVLVAPGPTSDVTDSVRPDGVQVRYTLYFPKSYAGSLDRCRVQVRGEWLSVVGAPRRFDEANCPTRWNMSAEAGVVDG